jgi:V/A-type H+-transporting ATPase subunit I
MAWREAVEPVRMQRVALVSPLPLLRSLLVEVAAAGVVDVDRPPAADSALGPSSRLLRARHPTPVPVPVLSLTDPTPERWADDSRFDLLAGEAELETYAAAAVSRDGVAAVAGWAPSSHVEGLAGRLADVGAGVVPLHSPRGLDPPTLLRADTGARQAFAPLVRTYATVPYADVDPTLLAGLAYVVMFGVMFGDAGHGALIVVAALALRLGRPARLARFRHLWLFLLGAGLTATATGLLYGEFSGPTGVVPVLWVSPLEEPVTVMAAALGLGAVLLAGAYVMGTANRWREGRWSLALVAPSGLAGFALFAGLGLVVLGAGAGLTWLLSLGLLVAVVGSVLAFVGFLAAAGGGGAGVTQACVELFDAVLRVGTNLVSFARLAAFGLTHAALGLVVWEATTALTARGALGVLAGVVVFVLGNALAFGLEALVAGIQALRLEYYELFSRVFTREGRSFSPWHLPVEPAPVRVPSERKP